MTMFGEQARRMRWLAKPFVFFSFIMLLKIYLAKSVLHPDGSWLMPLVTDLPAVLFVFGLIEWAAPKRKFGAYLIADLIMTIVYFAVIMYYKYFGIIVTYHALQQVGQVTEVRGSVMQLLHPYYLLIFTDIVVFLVLMLASKRFREWRRQLSGQGAPRPYLAALLALSFFICSANVWQSRESINELKRSENMGIIPYQTVEIAHGAKDALAGLVSEPEPPTDVTLPAIAELKDSGVAAMPRLNGIAKGKNLIVIQLEAMQTFLLNATLNGMEITPNMNELLASAVYFPNFYQMVGQGNTADAEFVMNTSLYVPRHGAASQVFGDRLLPSLPRVLKQHGYYTATFHTNDVKFWNRNNLYRALGFDEYFDREFFGDEDLVFFGSSDEVLYRNTLQKLKELSAAGRPFYAQIISMSAHHPFNIPERKVRFPLPESYKDTLVGHYIAAQHYADEALGMFIRDLKESGLWDDSLIVIYGDHMGVPIYSLTAHERRLMQELLGREYTPAEMLNVPLMLLIPGMEEGRAEEIAGGHVDILPTIANLLGVSLGDQIHFGQDLLNTRRNLLPQRYYLPSGSFINDTGVFVPGKGFEDGEFFPFRHEPGDAGAGAGKEEYERALKLLDKSDRYLRSLPRLD